MLTVLGDRSFARDQFAVRDDSDVDYVTVTGVPKIFTRGVCTSDTKAMVDLPIACCVDFYRSSGHGISHYMPVTRNSMGRCDSDNRWGYLMQ